MIDTKQVSIVPQEAFGLWSMPRSAWTALPAITLPTPAELVRSRDPVKEREAAALRRRVFEVPVSEQTWWQTLD